MNCILVRGQSVSSLSEGEILCAFNELKSRRPEHRYSVKAIGENQRTIFQQGDKIQEIRIAKSLDAMVSVELLINFQATVRLSIKNFTSISYSLPTIDLQETLKNLECFVDAFPKNFERFENALVENEKKAKIVAMAKVSIKTKRAIDVLWVLCGKSAFEDNCGWIKKLKRNRVTFIPRAEFLKCHSDRHRHTHSMPVQA